MKGLKFLFFLGLLIMKGNFSSADEEDFHTLMKKGYGFVKGGSLQKALQIYKKAQKQNPLNVDVYYNLSAVTYELKLCSDFILYTSAFLYLTADTSENKKMESKMLQCGKNLKKGGILKLNTAPEGVEVWINGIITGKSPLKELHLDEGKYLVETIHPDFEDEHQKVELKSGEEKSIVLELKKKITYGYLELKIHPPDGVKVYLNDELIGTTPFEIKKLESKKYLLKLEKDGYDNWVRYITIEREKTYKVEATMEKIQKKEDKKTSPHIL